MINSAKIKLFSTIGPRAAFGMTCLELIKEDPNLIVVTGDVSTSAGLDRFKKNHKDNYIDVGIAEQNMIGIAAGLSSEGHNVFTTTFSPFQTLRCCEQIKVNLGYMKNKVVMVGLASGIVLGTLGYTHCSIEDISIMRSIPNITVINPADGLEVYKAAFALLKYDKPAYLRLTGTTNSPQVYEKDYDFKIGKSIILKKGEMGTIFCTGSMVYPSLMAANKLYIDQKIDLQVVNVHTIKPLDVIEISSHIKNSKKIFTIEEHSIIGGLGSAISEVNSSLINPVNQTFIGLPDDYGKGGEYEDLKVKFGLSEESIYRKIYEIFKIE